MRKIKTVNQKINNKVKKESNKVLFLHFQKQDKKVRSLTIKNKLNRAFALVNTRIIKILNKSYLTTQLPLKQGLRRYLI
jgi:exonuclease VII large subunit